MNLFCSSMNPLRMLLLAGIFVFLLESTSIVAAASSGSLEAQVVTIMYKESAGRDLKAGIMGVGCAPVGNEERISDAQRRSIEENLGNRLTANLIREIERTGNRKRLAIMERERLDVILREKELQVTGLTEQYAASIGGLAGLDVILLGECRGYREPALISVKAIRVKDGEVLGVAGRTGAKKLLANVLTDVRVHSWNAVPVNMADGGTVTVEINVQRGNPVNVDLMSSAEFDKFKREKKHKHNSSFEAKKTMHYHRSAYLSGGEYMLVISDKALGVKSHHSSDVRVTAYLEPE